ncbi:MAG: hypothetical protein EBR02_06030 [Alphaproteobacteria bacterium]|nr:hypothetical protein [Alphaproteobacteria bacterium]
MSERPPLPFHLTRKPPPAVVNASSKKAEFQKMKEDALELIDWALEDVSPDPQHKIHLKMGIEREGRFISPAARKMPDGMTMDTWVNENKQATETIAKTLGKKLKRIPNFEKVYCDESGHFLVEMTTQPVRPLDAARATKRISSEMIKQAEALGYTASFDNLRADFLEEVGSKGKGYRPLSMLVQNKEVFDTESGKVFGASAQHANVSLWLGNRNLLCDESDRKNIRLSPWAKELVSEAMRTLPCMTLPCRNNDYYHIKERRNYAPLIFSVTLNVKSTEVVNIVSKKAKEDENITPEVTRLEIRLPASRADPLDAALSAAIPCAKAFIETAKMEKGRVVLDKNSMPVFDAEKSEEKPPPVLVATEKHIAETNFNPKDGNNLNFVFLDALAEWKIAKLQAQVDAGGNKQAEEALRDAKKKLDHLGTRLHHAYCEEHKTIEKSYMELPPQELAKQ